ncbi:hypothetical protein R4227_05755 [Gordonia amicalis]|uniref:hypothetical protein n=1 Tax=Gordonia amicalis TaxID=89053 RepID=UPI002952CE52|nr:hypothetical protein [Gordonia amicalis]MDV7099648.1 hypothetical protein [Gordonia amicalis]
MLFPVDHYGLVRRGAALDAAFSDNQLAAAVKGGDLLRLIPGVFVRSSPAFGGREGAQRLHRLKFIAVATTGTAEAPRLPLGHASAAAVHGLPLLKPDIEYVHVINRKKSGGSVLGHRHVHAATVDDVELVEVDGMLVTSLERTAVDVAAAGSFAQALTAFDQALRAGADRDRIAQILAGRRRQGIRNARRALSLASGLSESVGESWSRAQMIEAGLPVPRLQHEFRCRSATYRADFDWDEKLVGEFDGMAKYGRLREPGTTVADSLVREKRREDELRALGVMVVRWTWSVLEEGSLPDLLRPWLGRLDLIPGTGIPA